MKRTQAKILSALLITVLTAHEAAAWGPRAREAVARGSLQIARRTHPDALRTEDRNYDEDFFQGAVAGREILIQSTPLSSETLAIAAVASQIQLLRETRKYGMGSYFAHRLGALSGLAADLFLPYSFASDGYPRTLRLKIESDTEKHINEYIFKPVVRQQLIFVSSPHEFFEIKRPFFTDSSKMISDDYKGGVGYNGFLAKAAEAYFGRAIESTANIIHTVLLPHKSDNEVPPSPQSVSKFFVAEIEYLLNEKRNYRQAQNAYSVFVSINTGTYTSYERIGDLFYAFGTEEGQERGVREWKIAHRNPGVHRTSVSKKLSDHYIRKGAFYFDRHDTPESMSTDLDNALRSFQFALEYDRTNPQAARRINNTHIRIKERRELYDVQLSIISSVEIIMQEAEKSSLNGDYGSALQAYNQAIQYLGGIGTDFQDLADTSSRRTKEFRNSVREIIQDILGEADTQVNAGDEARDARQFDDAIRSYESVARILDDIPPSADAEIQDDKRDKLAAARSKIDRAKRDKQTAQADQGGTKKASPFPLKKKG